MSDENFDTKEEIDRLDKRFDQGICNAVLLTGVTILGYPYLLKPDPHYLFIIYISFCAVFSILYWFASVLWYIKMVKLSFQKTPNLDKPKFKIPRQE